MMPFGPVIMSPDRMVRSGARELIIKKPHLFKIGTLSQIAKLFPSGKPFYAGLGNRDTDAVSYLDVGILLSNIYIINPSGVLHHFDSIKATTSFKDLMPQVSILFPRDRLRPEFVRPVCVQPVDDDEL